MPSRRRFLAVGAACAAAPFASACQNALGPSKIDHDWDVQDRGRFTFYSRPASFAARSVDDLFTFLDYQYDATAAMLDVRYAGRISLFLHTSATDAGLPSDRSGVAYPDTQTVRAVCVPPIDGNLMVLLSHECNHVIANNTLGSAGTSFMNEGTATAVIGERYHAQGRHFLYPWTAARIGQLPSISTLVDDSHWNDGPQDVAYNTSASFIAWLIDTRGPASFKQIFTARSSELDGRVRSAYGAPLTQLETEWQIFVTGWRGAGV